MKCKVITLTVTVAESDVPAVLQSLGNWFAEDECDLYGGKKTTRKATAKETAAYERHFEHAYGE